MSALTGLARPLLGTSAERADPCHPEPQGLLRRSPLVTFLVLSCLLSWWPGALQAAGIHMPGPPVTGVGPFLAAVIVLGLTQGRLAVGRLLRSMIRARVPARAYLAALGLPLLVSGTAILVTLALGAARPQDADIALWTSIPILLLVVLLVPGIGVLIAMVFHATNNAVGGGYASQLFDGRDQAVLGLLTAAGWWLVAGAVLIRTRRQQRGTPAFTQDRSAPLEERS
jgi:hypothetical protein